MNLFKTSLALIVLISSFQTLAKAEENNEWITKKKQSSSIIKKKDSSFITKKKRFQFHN